MQEERTGAPSRIHPPLQSRTPSIAGAPRSYPLRQLRPNEKKEEREDSRVTRPEPSLDPRDLLLKHAVPEPDLEPSLPCARRRHRHRLLSSSDEDVGLAGDEGGRVESGFASERLDQG